MARTNKIIDATVDEVESAKETAVTLLQNNAPKNTMDLFFSDNLEEIENGIRQLNDFSNKSWLLSAILLYTLIYSKDLYLQSGLGWAQYSKQARERLGLDPRDITDQLSAARFFIKNHLELERAGFDPVGNNRKLSRAELATDLSKDVHKVIQHLAKDTWQDFHDWYQSYKPGKKKIEEFKRSDIEIKDGHYFIKGNEAVSVSDKIPTEDKEKLEGYIYQIFDALRKGYEPAIIEVYDKKEAMIVERLRDKYRQEK